MTSLKSNPTAATEKFLTLLSKLPEDFHVRVRQTVQNSPTTELLWISIQNPVPFSGIALADLESVAIKICYPYCDPESTHVVILEFHDNILRIEGTLSSPDPLRCGNFVLNLTSPIDEMGTLYSGTFIFRQTTFIVTLLDHDFGETRMLKPLQFKEPAAKRGTIIFYDNQWWSFGGWYLDNKVKLKSDKLEIQALVSNCRILSTAMQKRQEQHQQSSPSISLMASAVLPDAFPSELITLSPTKVCLVDSPTADDAQNEQRLQIIEQKLAFQQLQIQQLQKLVQTLQSNNTHAIGKE